MPDMSQENPKFITKTKIMAWRSPQRFLVWCGYMVLFTALGYFFAEGPGAFIAFFAALFLTYPFLPLILSVAEKLLIGKITGELLPKLTEYATHPLRHYALSCSSNKKGKLSGSAIAWDGEFLYIVEGGEAARIPWNMVDEWKWVVQDPNRIIPLGHVDMATRSSMNLANLDASAAAYAMSGMFIYTTDKIQPVWQFTSRDEDVLKKWHEILVRIGEGENP